MYMTRLYALPAVCYGLYIPRYTQQELYIYKSLLLMVFLGYVSRTLVAKGADRLRYATRAIPYK